MGSTDKPDPEKELSPPESTKLEAARSPPPLESRSPAYTYPPPPPPPPDNLVVVDVVLRLLLFAAALVAVVVMVTSKQTKPVGRLPYFPFAVVFRQAKFNYSPAFIYFLVALSLAGLYAIVTTVVSFLSLLKPSCSTKLLAHFIIFDVLVLGIVAAATGAAGAVVYIGLKGNSHVGWTKVCNVFDKYCQHLGASVGVSLIASIVLVLLVILSAYSLSKKIPK